MKKKIFGLVLAFCMLLPGVMLLSACNWEHEHSYNGMGMCVICDDDISQMVYRNADDEYVVSNLNVETGKEYYFRFSTNGEYGMDILLENSTAQFEKIEIWTSASISADLPTKKTSDTHYSYEKWMPSGREYGLKITFKTAGTATLRMKNMNLEPTDLV